jgi:uncharacterized protein YndB with AHSA1/START domain
MAQWEHLSRVSEGYRSGSGGVEGVEEIDEQRNGTESVIAVSGDEETHPRGEESPEHLWEGEYQEVAPPEGVDCPDGWPSENKVDDTKAEGCKEGIDVARTSFREDGGGVEGDDIDCVLRD